MKCASCRSKGPKWRVTHRAPVTEDWESILCDRHLAVLLVLEPRRVVKAIAIL